MKLFVKKAAPKKAPFKAINRAALRQVKGGEIVITQDVPN